MSTLGQPAGRRRPSFPDGRACDEEGVDDVGGVGGADGQERALGDGVARVPQIPAGLGARKGAEKDAKKWRLSVGKSREKGIKISYIDLKM